MANFIEADVIQKIATEAQWLTQTRIPYKGQIMLVSDSTGKVVNMKVGDGSNTFANLNYMFDFTNSQRISAVAPGALPTPSEANTYMVVTEVGDYTFGGNTIVSITQDGYEATLWWTGTVWISNGVIKLMPDGSSTLVNGEIPSGEAVIDYVQPLFDSLMSEDDFSEAERTGIISSSGGLDFSQTVSDLSYTIPVELGDIIEYKGSTTSALIAVGGYKTTTISSSNLVKVLLEGGIYEEVQRLVIDDPEIKFIKAASRNSSYPGNTNFLYLKRITSVIPSIENQISELNDDVEELSENMVQPFVDNDVTPVKTPSRSINTTNGNLANLSSSGFPDTEYSDFLPIDEGVDYYVSGWFGSSNGIAGYDETKTYNSRLADTSNNAVNKIEYADNYKLNIPPEVKFIRGGTKDRNLYPFVITKKERIEDLVIETSNRVTALEGKDISRIAIKYVNATTFEVNIHDVTKSDVVTHRFIRDRRVNSFGSVTNMVTEDVWYPNSIIVNGNTIAQGNLNFIYMIDSSSYSNEDGHVGAGHGCVVAKWTKFLADGKEFDPTSSFDDIVCSTFSISYYADCYAIDKASTLSGENAIPKLDGSNNPIIANNHGLEATYYLDGRIEHRNILYIRRDNTKFSQCHAAMISCYRPYFDKVIFPNPAELTINEHHVEGGSVVVTPIGGSIINSSSPTRYYSNEITQLGAEGYNYKIKNTIINMNNAKQKNCNVQFYYGSSPNWTKGYIQAVICTSNPSSNPSLAEVFNNGDVIDILVKREVSIS